MEYFSGARRSFDLPTAPEGTSFQLRVWQALAAIPYGETVSYGELARRLGLSRGARAVGLANGANPLPIVVPCHRVIGADGMVWGIDGWMNGVWNSNAKITAIDFAGGTVVHMSSGWSALVLCVLLGHRLGFRKEIMLVGSALKLIGAWI